MPIYPYRCENDNCRSKNADVDILKPCKDSSRRENCQSCHQALIRIYAFTRPPQFTEFFDEQYGTYISSRKQEAKLMKAHGHIYTRDVLGKKYEQARKHAKWKIAHGFGEHGANTKKVR